MAVENKQRTFRQRMLGLLTIAAGNREPIAFMGYLHLLAQREGYNLAQAKQAYLECLNQYLTPEGAKRAPEWPEVQKYLIEQKVVTDWKDQSSLAS